MRHPKMRRIGLMLELDWPFERHLSVFVGTQRYAQESGRWECIVDEQIPDTLRKAGGKRIYDGIIARATPALAQAARRRSVPVVNTWFGSPVHNLPLVSPDFQAIGRMAAEHLLAIGLRRFTCIGAKDRHAERQQVESFLATIQDAGAECQWLLAPASYTSRADVRRRFHQSLPEKIKSWQPPIGIYLATPGMMARYVAHEVAKLGLRIPEDVAIVAGINEPMLCVHPAPSLTSIEASYEQVGYQAAQWLDELMDGKLITDSLRLVPPRRVAARQSTDFMAVSDPLVSAALQFLAAHVHKRLTVNDVARAAHASRRTLERRFQASLGRTIAAEIRRLRMERAKRYLLDSTMPIKTITRLAGFTSKQRLYDAFRDAGDQSIATYRAQRSER
jgi:LacI family transcriptional regulator